MGISGLLPLLKSIQVNKHLSEFAGQTLAVDAYVWLHRGIFTCATELATGKKTTKYVDYAMHRVRLLRHHKIQPYIVFDGGPLPAKRGTEAERKERRAENLAKGNVLAAQGKHSQAREYYVKCVDVTPQMAFQLIKALRAEGISYVVAPYEADAQLAYLERMGIVDGIITEDSDLLVFGCRNVLFKLDSVSSTITVISRADFGSVTAAEGGISLHGWSDSQFRAMAILSGCDYLPSIPGVGLKTAWSLLRKHKTVDQVIRAVRLEGKKRVPKGYLEAYKLAENVFLHQRVYCPLDEKLVCLTEVPQDEVWNSTQEAYVGGDIEMALARQLARGDVDPVTLLPMIDINPGHVPRVVKPRPFAATDLNCSSNDQGKGKAHAKPASEGILSFFAPKAKIVPVQNSLTTASKMSVAGKASGKRTLAEVMDEDLASKRTRRESLDWEYPRTPVRSRFFSGDSNNKYPPRKHISVMSDAATPADPSEVHCREKENIWQGDRSQDSVCQDLSMVVDDPPDAVAQEEGYISPTHSYRRLDTPDLSSPARSQGKRLEEDWDDFGVDIISSPAAARSLPYSSRRFGVPTYPRVLVPNTSTASGNKGHQDVWNGPDLRETLAIDLTSDINLFEDERPSPSMTTSSSGPVTPEDTGKIGGDEIKVIDVDSIFEDTEEKKTRERRNNIVATGWWNKWARNDNANARKVKRVPQLRRTETTITPTGRQSGYQPRRSSVPSKFYPSDTSTGSGKSL